METVLSVHSSLESSNYFPVEKNYSTRKILNVIDEAVIRFFKQQAIQCGAGWIQTIRCIVFPERKWRMGMSMDSVTEYVTVCVCPQTRLCAWTYHEWENVQMHGWWRREAAASEEQRCAMTESRWKLPKYNPGIQRRNEIPLHRGEGVWLNQNFFPEYFLNYINPGSSATSSCPHSVPCCAKTRFA